MNARLFFFIICKSIMEWYISIFKNRNHMITSLDVEKSFWQNSASSYDKNSPESWNWGNIPQHNKEHIWQAHSIGKSWNYSSKIRNGSPLSSFLFSVVLEVLIIAVTQRKGIKTYNMERKNQNYYYSQITQYYM